MNDKLHTYFKKAGEEISLTHEEREKMKGMVRAYMAMKPIRESYGSAPTTSPSFRWTFALRPVAAVLTLAVFASSAGVSYAAESALPGDILYAVKTRVNEPLKGALAVSPSAKTEWAMEVAGKRVKEATTLAAEGRLDAEVEKELQANFEIHARRAAENISAQESASPSGVAETAVRFEARLAEYERVLTQVGEDMDVEVRGLASSVEAEREHISSVRARSQERALKGSTKDKKDAVSHMRDSAKKRLDESSGLARTVSGALASSTAESVALQLLNASATISAGENIMDDDSETQALDAFRDALSETEKIGVFLEASSDIHKRTGLIIRETRKGPSEEKSGELQAPARAGSNGSAQRAQDNDNEKSGNGSGKSGEGRTEISPTSGESPAEIERPATAREEKTDNSGKDAESPSEPSQKSGSGKKGSRDREELQITLEGESRNQGSGKGSRDQD